MVAEPLDVFCLPFRIQLFDRADDLGMERAAPLMKQAAERNIMGQGMLERVFELREQTGFVEELGGLEVREPAPERRFGQLADGVKEGKRHVLANDSRGLEQTLVLGREPVDAGGENGLDRGWHLDTRFGLC